MKINFLNAGKLFLIFIVLILSGLPAVADVSGVNGVSLAGNSHCLVNGVYKLDWNSGMSSTQGLTTNTCTLSSNFYVPHSGDYFVEMKIMNASGQESDVFKSGIANFDGSQTITAQNIKVTSSSRDSFYWGDGTMSACQYLVDNETQERYTLSSKSPCNTKGVPLPPSPAPPDTACTLNDGNALSVNLGSVDRAQIPTVPGSGSMRHLQVPVECTGDDVTVNMQMSYTPITLGADQIIKSTANGLGVSVVYDSKVLSSSDVTPVTFLEGSNSVDLAFQAVRDPTVESKDIPTGAFTASAVLVMTQQ